MRQCKGVTRFSLLFFSKPVELCLCFITSNSFFLWKCIWELWLISELKFHSPESTRTVFRPSLALSQYRGECRIVMWHSAFHVCSCNLWLLKAFWVTAILATVSAATWTHHLRAARPGLISPSHYMVRYSNEEIWAFGKFNWVFNCSLNKRKVFKWKVTENQ